MCGFNQTQGTSGRVYFASRVSFDVNLAGCGFVVIIYEYHVLAYYVRINEITIYIIVSMATNLRISCCPFSWNEHELDNQSK